MLFKEKIEAFEGWDIEPFCQIQIAMDALCCPSGDVSVANLSCGEKRRVALCHLFLQYPDLLLLGEPTNHLDTESVTWLERFLKENTGTVLLVTTIAISSIIFPKGF